MSNRNAQPRDLDSDEYQIPYLPHYRFSLVCVNRGPATHNQINQIVLQFFNLIGEECDYMINVPQRGRTDLAYVWFKNVDIAERFLQGENLTISKEIDDPNWKPPSIPLIEAKKALLSSASWDDEEEEMNYESPIDFSLSSSSGQWGDRTDVLTLDERLDLLEKSYVRPKIVVRENVSHALRYRYTPEQRKNLILRPGEIPQEYGSIGFNSIKPNPDRPIDHLVNKTMEAFSLYDAPCIPNVLHNTAIPKGCTVNDIRKLMGRFATTETVTINTKFGSKEVPSPHINFVESKNGKGTGSIYVTYNSNTHDSHVAWMMTAWIDGVKLENGTTASFAFKRKLVK